MSVRPYSSDRERIQTEWNPHQHGRCAINLSFADWQRENWRKGGGLDWTQSLCFCLCSGLPGRHREGEREMTALGQRNEKMFDLSSPTIHIWNSCRRGQKDANTDMGSFPTSETEWVAEKGKQIIQISMETRTFLEGSWKVAISQQWTINQKGLKLECLMHTYTHMLPHLNAWVVMVC